MKIFTALMIAAAIVCGGVGCGSVGRGSAEELAENAWLILVTETSPEMTVEQQSRTAVVLDRLFDIADVHDVRKWQTDPRIEKITTELAAAMPSLMVEGRPSQRAKMVIREFPEYMEVTVAVTRDMLLREFPDIPEEDLKKFSRMAATALAEFLARTDWALEAVREQLADPVGRRLGIGVARALPWIVYGEGPCPVARDT